MVKKSKPAIAMIELIFALVIMGIVLMSAPMLIHQSVKSGNVALQQEAIAATVSQTSVILSMHWDETNANIANGASPILDANRTGFRFNAANEPLGLVDVSGRTSTDNNNTTLVPTIAGITDSNESNFSTYDDVDDFDGQNFGIEVFNTEITTADKGDYVDKYLKLKSTVDYTSEGVTNLNSSNINITNDISSSNIVAPISNIKFITVNLTSDSNITELDKDITLKAFSCNIGTYVPQDGGTL